MSFHVRIDPPVVDYLSSRDLTAADRERILEGTAAELGSRADEFLARNPHPYLPDRFEYDYSLMTEARVVREFLFLCSAEGHVYGVTEVLYAEETTTAEEA